MFPDLCRGAPHRGMIYVAMRSLRRKYFLWWKLPADRSDVVIGLSSSGAIGVNEQLFGADKQVAGQGQSD